MGGNILSYFKWFLIALFYFIWSFGRIAVHNAKVDELLCNRAWEDIKK